ARSEGDGKIRGFDECRTIRQPKVYWVGHEISVKQVASYRFASYPTGDKQMLRISLLAFVFASTTALASAQESHVQKGIINLRMEKDPAGRVDLVIGTA